jgi:hypothetical protein
MEEEMKRIHMLVLAGLILVCGAATAMAGEFEIPESVVMSPNKFEGYTPKKADVTFNHVSHMDYACQDCHHTAYDTWTIQSCSSAGCHDDIATRSGVNSVYRTFHTTQDTTKSCVGCHLALKKEGTADAPVVCNDCHM